MGKVIGYEGSLVATLVMSIHLPKYVGLFFFHSLVTRKGSLLYTYMCGFQFLNDKYISVVVVLPHLCLNSLTSVFIVAWSTDTGVEKSGETLVKYTYIYISMSEV